MRDVAFRAGLLLLSATFFFQLVVVRHDTRDLFRLAFCVFHDASHGSLRSALAL